MSGPLDGKTLSWEVPSDSKAMTIVIGRSQGAHINIEYDQQVSRTHAHLICELSSGRCVLVDKNSRNGTFIGFRNDKVAAEQPHEIAPNTLFRVGRTWLRFDGIQSGSNLEALDEDGA